MTETYATGGHTRVAERWIELSPSNEMHSLVLTDRERQIVPKRLVEAVKQKGGTITFLPDHLSDEAKAVELRRLSAAYSRVVLHHHMYDVVPLLAYGTTDVKCPVVLFNHADHRFWIGLSVADATGETRGWGRDLMLRVRGGHNSHVLGIPVDQKQARVFDKREVRERLGLPQDKKLILTVGSAEKYRPLGEMDFLAVADALLKEHLDRMLLAIGPSVSTLPHWKAAVRASEGRIKLVGRVPPEVLYAYAGAADLGIDSFPMSGGTALGDLISCGCPVLSLKCPTDHLDYIHSTKAYCLNEAELLEKAEHLFADPIAARENVDEVRAALIAENGVENWKKSLLALYEAAGDVHAVHPFVTPTPQAHPTDLDMYLHIRSFRIRQRLKIPFLGALYSVRLRGKKMYRWVPCGKSIAAVYGEVF